MKYYLIAGEASGDLHGSNLMRALKREDPEAEFRCMGGDLMREAGGDLTRHYREMAYMGFIPVLTHLGTILRNLRACKNDIRAYRPDVVILIDYPGFNLKVARFVHEKLRIPVHYYISPKIWAWKRYRIKAFRRYVDRMFCILPFEVPFFERLNYPVDYVGNPTLDAVSRFRKARPRDYWYFRSRNKLKAERPIIAILPGSRKQEIRDNLPTMLRASDDFPEHIRIVAGAPGIEPEFYEQFIPQGAVRLIFGQTYDLLRESDAALVTSGTATLEACLFRVPQIVCYRTPGGRLANFIFKRFFHVPYISLVNLIAGHEVIIELFGGDFTVDKIKMGLLRLCYNEPTREEIARGYDEVIRALGEPGASERAARLIVEALR